MEKRVEIFSRFDKDDPQWQFYPSDFGAVIRAGRYYASFGFSDDKEFMVGMKEATAALSKRFFNAPGHDTEEHF
jgi:hypothetical protein